MKTQTDEMFVLLSIVTIPGSWDRPAVDTMRILLWRHPGEELQPRCNKTPPHDQYPPQS